MHSFFLSSIHPFRTLQKERWIAVVLQFVSYQEGNPIGRFTVLHAREFRVACSVFITLELLLNADPESAHSTRPIYFIVAKRMTASLVTCDKLGEVELGIVQSVRLIGERGCLLNVLRESNTVME